MKLAIKKHSGDFVAILVLLVLSIVVAGYILNHERLRFPLIQSPPFKIDAEFSTAQAVIPARASRSACPECRSGRSAGSR